MTDEEIDGLAPRTDYCLGCQTLALRLEVKTARCPTCELQDFRAQAETGVWLKREEVEQGIRSLMECHGDGGCRAYEFQMLLRTRLSS